MKWTKNSEEKTEDNRTLKLSKQLWTKMTNLVDNIGVIILDLQKIKSGSNAPLRLKMTINEAIELLDEAADAIGQDIGYL